MANHGVTNGVRQKRTAAGWTQAELAVRAGLSRAEVSAVETGRSVPSAAVALALAGALGCMVEELFRLGVTGPSEETWAWSAGGEPRYWEAWVGDRVVRYPVEPTHTGVLVHDGSMGGGPGPVGVRSADPRRTLVVAGCDPAIGLLAAELRRRSDVRLIPLVRSSRRALAHLAEGRVHVAGVHLGDGDAGNEDAIRDALGPGHRRVNVARWTEGLALAPGLGHESIGSAVRARLRWVGREEGSGARRCLDEILEGRMPRPEGYDRTATDHRGVVETIRTGWAQAGVCVQLAAVEGGLNFLPAREEDYDLCYPASLEADPRLIALLDVLRSVAFRRLLGALPGYATRRTGELS